MINSETVLLEVNRLHSGGYDASYFPRPGEISRYKQFELVFINPSDFLIPASELYQPVVDHYVKLQTDFPPIVLDENGKIIDGRQRLAAAKRRGETTISAYKAIF